MSSRSVQYLAMISGSFLSLISGINLAWSSPYLPLLDENNPEVSPMKLTSDESFWCSVMPLIGAPPGALLAALLVDRIGRKYVLLATDPIVLMSFLAIAYTRNVIVLDVARFLIGSVEGALCTAQPIYFGEIAEPKIRGLLSASVYVAALFGVLFINVLGSYTSIYLSAMICSVIPVLHFVTFIWMPRSPYFLMKKGLLDESKTSLEKLRGTKDVNEEYTNILAAVKRQEAQASNKKAKYSDLFTQKGNRKAGMIYLILCCTNKFSGSNPVLFYAHTIFATADGFLSPDLSVICLHSVGVASGVFATYLIDKFGRRPLILFSTITCALAMGCQATYFTIQYLNLEILEQLNWVPLASLLTYYIVYNLGLSLASLVFLSELFPTSVKGYALGTADTTSVIIGTIVSKMFHGLSQSYGMHVPFWLFSGCCLIGSLMIYLFVLETKGKTLDEIQLELSGHSGTS